MDIEIRRTARYLGIQAIEGNSTFEIGFMNEAEALEFAEKLIRAADNICEYYDRPFLGDKGFVAKAVGA